MPAMKSQANPLPLYPENPHSRARLPVSMSVDEFGCIINMGLV
jgi:hypothetical protein